MMKYLWTILILLTMSATALAEDFIVTNDEYIVVSGSTTDTLGRKPLIPDSIHIFICDSAQTTLHDAAYTSGDAQASIDGEHIIFSDQWNDLNGAAEIGVFHMTVTIWSDGDNNIDVSSEREYTIRGVTSGTAITRDSSMAALARLDNIQVDTDSIATVHADANKGNLKANVSALALEASLFDGNLNLDNATGTLSDAQIDDITVTAGTVSDKAGYSLSVTPPTAAQVYSEFISGSNEDQFKANVSALALEASLFDPTTDSVNPDISNQNVANGWFAVNADSVWARAIRILTTADWSTHSAANVWAVGTRALTDKANFSLTTAERGAIEDSVYANRADYGGAGTVSAADIVAIVDTFYNRDSADVNAGGATSFGTLMMKPAYVQGSAGSAPDSTTLSNMLHRIMWGTAKGDGSDSSTIAQRDILVAQFVTGVIDAAAIAADAIGASELAGDAAEEIADSTLDQINTGGTHNVNNSLGKQVRQILSVNVVTDGTAQAGGATYIRLAAATSFPDDVLNGMMIVLIGGTGQGQSRHIHDWTNVRDSATLHAGDDWIINPAGDTEYEVFPFSPVEVIHLHDSAKVDIANAVHDALVADHTTPLSYGDTVPKMLREIQDTVTDNRETLAAMPDTTNTNAIKDTTNAIIDTLQLQDDWGAKQASLLLVIDTVNGVIDTLQLHDDWVGTQAQLLQLLADVDTLGFLSGYCFGCKAYSIYTTDKDSLYIVTPAGDTIARWEFYHPGDTAGYPPDTTIMVRD